MSCKKYPHRAPPKSYQAPGVQRVSVLWAVVAVLVEVLVRRRAALAVLVVAAEVPVGVVDPRLVVVVGEAGGTRARRAGPGRARGARRGGRAGRALAGRRARPAAVGGSARSRWSVIPTCHGYICARYVLLSENFRESVLEKEKKNIYIDFFCKKQTFFYDVSKFEGIFLSSLTNDITKG